MACRLSSTSINAILTTRNVLPSKVTKYTSTTKLYNSAFQNKYVDAKRNCKNIRKKPDQGNQIKNMGNSPKKSRAAVAANCTSTKKNPQVKNMRKTIDVKGKAFTFFVLELLLSFNLLSATIAKPFKRSYSEKVEHL
jgi:hypothetical protein